MRGFALKLKKSDFFAALFVIVLIILLFCLRAQKDVGQTAAVYLNGREIARLDLNKDVSFKVNGDYHAVVTVKNGRVSVTESDCPHGDCVKSGSINKKGQSIVCLPNRLTVSVEGDGLDAVIG